MADSWADRQCHCVKILTLYMTNPNITCKFCVEEIHFKTTGYKTLEHVNFDSGGIQISLHTFQLFYVLVRRFTLLNDQ